MTIGIDASRALLPHKTGVHWYVSRLIQSLQEVPSDHRFIWYADRPWKGTFNPNNRTEMRVLRWPLKRGWTQVRLSYEMLRRAPDVLIIPASATPIAHPKKTMTVIHDVGYLQYPDYVSRIERDYLAISTNHAVHVSWKIITVSQWTRRELLRLSAISDPDRIIVAPIGIDTTYYCPQNPETNDYDTCILKKYGITTPYIITVGRIDARKNLMMLAHAWGSFVSRHSNYQLIHVGPIGYHGQDIIHALTSLPHADRIRFLGWIAEDEKRALLRNASVFVFPSLYEGFGMPLLEAQSCGVPCIAADSSSLVEVGGTAALYVNPHAVHEWSDALARIVSDDSLRWELCEAGYANARRYTWENCARIILDAALS